MSIEHIHKRKRAAGRARQPYPAQSGIVRFLDKLVYAAGIIAPAMMIPQLILLYGEKNADGIAPITWLAIGILNIPWILYGIAHKEKPLVMTYILWIICNGLMFVGAVIY